jgi:LacI family repressor for deo operon, udp, cdd, tsx, nupC, and nupG
VPSIKDVARLAGVSTATVSRTLANPEKVAERTRQRVMSAVTESGYVANSMARNLRRRRSNTVVVLVPDIANPFYAEIIQGIERVAHGRHYRILLGDIQGDAAREQDYASLVQQRQADGIISLSDKLPFQLQTGQRVADPGWPPLAMACEYYGEIAVPVVRIDNRAAAAQAVEHLLREGHRRIAYIDGPTHMPICRERLVGYEAAMLGVNIAIDPQLVAQGDFGLHSGGACMDQLLEIKRPPSAVFAANDEMAIGAIKAIKAGGRSVPEDISVVGFDDIRFAEYIDPPLTTVHQPRSQMGETLMRLMLDILAGDAPLKGEIVLPHRLVVRGSTAPPSG